MKASALLPTGRGCRVAGRSATMASSTRNVDRPSTSDCRSLRALGQVSTKSLNSGRYASRKGRLEEGDQFLGDGFGFKQWGKVTDARQLSDVRVDDVLGHVAFHVGEEGAE